MVKFVKYQGTGNDFIIFNEVDLNEGIRRVDLAQQVCNRKFGIGSDGMMVIEKSNIADIKMCFYNADGSVATMCGNGIRCFAKDIYSKGIVKERNFTVETLAGIMKVEIMDKGDVRVNLGKPLFVAEEIPKDIQTEYYINKEIIIGGDKFVINVLKIGTIHTVIFVDNTDFNIEKIGQAIENHQIFPMKTNVNFCKVVDSNNIEVTTWEKGVGVTLACGTGAAASAIFSSILYKCSNKINVKVAGGELILEDNDGEIFMTGPAECICEGVYHY